MKNTKKIICLTMFLALLFLMKGAEAQNKLALTITPPIIKNNISPGQIWKSYIKVVNNNDEEIAVYVQLVNFDTNGEVGTVKLEPKSEAEISGNDQLINNWIVIDRGPLKIPANKSLEIPFIVDVPDTVDPGDHHIVFLIGTMPNEASNAGSSIKISSMLGSLLLLNVSGDVKESGVIREFSSDKRFYGSGETNFILRFQNTGNTILQPQGEIKIIDFRGNVKGLVNINHNTSSGNVFPADIRRWQYTWPVPSSLLETGRYQAQMILTYGNVAKETTEQTLYFWVINWRPLLMIVGSILFVIFLIIFLVRRYIRKMIQSSNEQHEENKTVSASLPNRPRIIDDMYTVVDLKGKAKTTATSSSKKSKKKMSLSLIEKIIYIVLAAIILASAVFVFYYFDTMETGHTPIKEIEAVPTEPSNMN